MGRPWVPEREGVGCVHPITVRPTCSMCNFALRAILLVLYVLAPPSSGTAGTGPGTWLVLARRKWRPGSTRRCANRCWTVVRRAERGHSGTPKPKVPWLQAGRRRTTPGAKTWEQIQLILLHGGPAACSWAVEVIPGDRQIAHARSAARAVAGHRHSTQRDCKGRNV